ncbi:MAG: transcription termination factor Rho [Saccharofermentans sp.]|nr:transcription termination factor Rho [Saccharofermentans sp.]
MTELDTLNSKSASDLAVIAAAMGFAAPDEAGNMTKEQLVSLISGSNQSAAPEEPKEEKAPKARRGRKPKAEKAEAEKTEAEPEVKAEEKTEEKSEDKPEAQAEEKSEEKPKKKARSSSKKTAEDKAEPAAKKSRSSKKKTTKTEKEEKAEPAQEQISIADVMPEEEKPKADNSAASAKPGKSRKRRLSFGPDKNIEEVEIPAEEQAAEAAAPAEQEPEVQVPEIVYREVEGILSIGNGDKGDFSGFIHVNNYLPGEEDAYVPGQMIRRMGLRRGDKIKGLVMPPRGKDKYAPLKRVLEVNGIDVSETENYDVLRKRPRFESLTAIYPNERLTLETNQEDLSTRIIDLFSPIGKGQRGMIVSPPKAGKTILLQKVANSITANNPSCKLIVLLIDERPEEVTDMQRSIKGEVVYSTFDKRPENHVRVTELVLERAMRLVELGEDVVILLDSMTRLARAYNLTITPTGRTLSGGLDPGSLYGPKRFFGAARNIEFGGSLTIISTALIETGSRMDEVIFEEFKGTGNMEVTLDRKLADRRVFPAIAVDKSGTRREDLLLSREELEAVWLTRKTIADSDTVAATSAVLDFMKKTTSNASFILSVKKSFDPD